MLESFRERYPIVLTRSMRAARRWTEKHRQGMERAGLLASCSAQRLKPHAIDIRLNIDPVHWFLASPRDTRASSYLEDAATEFQAQGLELDWTIVTWVADLRCSGNDCRLALPRFSRGEVDGHEEARAAAVSEERVPRVAHAGSAGDGDLRPAGGEAGQD